MDDVSPLRRRMIEDMTVRNLSPRVCKVVRSSLAVCSGSLVARVGAMATLVWRVIVGKLVGHISKGSTCKNLADRAKTRSRAAATKHPVAPEAVEARKIRGYAR